MCKCSKLFVGVARKIKSKNHKVSCTSECGMFFGVKTRE